MYTIIVKTLFGLEETLKGELESINIKNVEILNRAVEFKGDLEDVYKCNLHLRTAISVLVRVGVARVEDENQLYRFVRSINWNQYFDNKKTIAISAVSFSEKLSHSLFVEQKTKDAIVDYFRDEFGDRPDVDVKNPDVKISLHISNDTCSIYLDSSGKPLYIRGFDKEIGEASLNEVLAAGIVLLSGWNKKDLFYDPMCGSGTFLSEAYMIARNMPATLHRKDFSFKNWNNYDSELWTNLLRMAKAGMQELNCDIVGTDLDPDAVDLAKQNLYKVDRAHNVNVYAADFFKIEPFADSGLIITNPPYGVRLQIDDITSFYRDIGNKLKFDFHGYSAWLISSEIQAIKFVGMKPDKKIIVYNGPLECRLNKYTIFKGKKRDHK